MLNLDLSQHNPVQSDSQYANVPLPSAHLVVIEESEMKESNKDGYVKGTNLLLELTILASSTGNEFVGEKLPIYIPFSGFEETAIKAGMKRLSTLAFTLGLGSFLQNKEDLHGTNFIVVLEKDGKTNFPRFKRILNAQGLEIADASGNFKPCELKDVALATELEKLLAIIGGNGQQQAPQAGQIAPSAVTPSHIQAHGLTSDKIAGTPPQGQATVPQNFTPNTNFGTPTNQPNTGAGNWQPQGTQTEQVQQAPNFGNGQQQANGFGANTAPNVPAWGQTVNTNNGQQ